MGCAARAKGEDHLRRGAELCFQLSDDEENHQDTGLHFQTPVG